MLVKMEGSRCHWGTQQRLLRSSFHVSDSYVCCVQPCLVLSLECVCVCALNPSM